MTAAHAAGWTRAARPPDERAVSTGAATACRPTRRRSCRPADADTPRGRRFLGTGRMASATACSRSPPRCSCRTSRFIRGVLAPPDRSWAAGDVDEHRYQDPERLTAGSGRRCLPRARLGPHRGGDRRAGRQIGVGPQGSGSRCAWTGRCWLSSAAAGCRGSTPGQEPQPCRPRVPGVDDRRPGDDVVQRPAPGRP